MTKWQPEAAGPSMWQVLAWTALLTFCLFSGMKYAENIVLVQAWGGWSPLDWAAHQLFPENFKADFPSGIAAYRMSSLMQLYVLVANLGVELESLVPWVVPFEVVFLGIGAAILFRKLTPQSPCVAMAIFAVLIVEGSARDMELARFGGAFYQGLFYNIADGLRLLGVAALFSGRIKIAALLFGLGVTVHPVMAAMACLFAIPYILLIFKRFSPRRWLIAATVFLTVAGAWIIPNILSAEVASGGIPSDQWLGLVRMFTYHWFPVDIGVFTRFHESYIIPLLCLLTLAALYLPRVIQGSSERLGVALGMALLAVTACAGVFISEFSTEPFLIKLALHRVSHMLIVVALLIVVAGLTDEILKGHFLETALAGALLLSPLVNLPVAFPLVATIFLLGLHALRACFSGESMRCWVAFALLAILLIAMSSYYLIGMQNTAAYLGGTLFWKVMGAFLIASILRWGLAKMGLSAAILNSISSIALLGTILFFAVSSVEHKSFMPPERKNLASDYLAVQRWAHNNTRHDSLFMIDPTIYYGWRDFSQRSSFGNLREWLHTSWLYDSQAAVYEEGRKRFDEFGIDIEPYKQIRPSIEGSHRLSDDVRQTFYLKDSDWFGDISRRYGISYLVIQRQYLKANLIHEEVFKNDSFVVYRFGD